MLETPTAIENADAIAAVPGVDVLLIGTNDLCAEMGIPGDFGNERVADAYRTMIAACRKHNKFPGMAGIYNEPLMQRYIEMGARFILSGNDAAFLMASAGQRTGLPEEDPHVNVTRDRRRRFTSTRRTAGRWKHVTQCYTSRRARRHRRRPCAARADRPGRRHDAGAAIGAAAEGHRCRVADQRQQVPAVSIDPRTSLLDALREQPG